MNLSVIAGLAHLHMEQALAPPVGVQRRVAGVFPGRDDVPVAPHLLLVAKGIVV